MVSKKETDIPYYTNTAPPYRESISVSEFVGEISCSKSGDSCDNIDWDCADLCFS